MSGCTLEVRYHAVEDNPRLRSTIPTEASNNQPAQKLAVVDAAPTHAIPEQTDDGTGAQGRAAPCPVADMKQTKEIPTESHAAQAGLAESEFFWEGSSSRTARDRYMANV